MSIASLTKRQKQTYKTIQDYFEENGIPPTLEEIGEKMKIQSPSAVHKHVTALREKGYLKNLHKSARSINLFEQVGKYKEIPLMGKVSAGEGVIPIENPEPIQVPSTMVAGSGNYYGLKIDGDSMIDDGIFNGDTVVIRSQSVAQNGDTVIVVIDGANELATIKKFYYLGDKIELRASNSNLKSWPRQFEVGKVEIRGKFCGLIRRAN